MFSLHKKACRKGKLPYSPSAKEPSGGVRKGRVREGSVEGPYGRSLSVPPDYGDSTVSRIILLKIKKIFILYRKIIQSRIERLRNVIFLQSMLLFVASLVKNYIRFFKNFCCGALHLEKF